MNNIEEFVKEIEKDGLYNFVNKHIADEAVAEVIKTFIDMATCYLSEEDYDQLIENVLDSLKELIV